MIQFASFLSPKFLKGLAFVAVAVFVAGAVYFHFDSIAKKDEQIAFLQGEKATLEANVATLEGAIETASGARGL